MGTSLLKQHLWFWLLVLSATCGHASAQNVTADTLPAVFRSAPAGWSVQSSKSLSRSQVDQLSVKWNVSIHSISNTFVAYRGRPIQINTVTCNDRDDAITVYKKLRQGKPNPRMVTRKGSDVFEFVARNNGDVVLALQARDAFEIQPTEATYRVQFRAVPIRGGDWMKLNQLCHLFKRTSAADSEAKTELLELTKLFEFGESFSLRRLGHGTVVSDWQITESDSVAGCRVYSVRGVINSRRGGRTPSAAGDASDNVAATVAWPADTESIKSLAEEITSDLQSEGAKVESIRKWMLSPNGIRFGGPITGSRYGTQQALLQKYGHCWDLSDVFITLCRANKIPCRQVFGWLAGSEGHVWCEVLVDDTWYAIDPGSSLPCGSDYIPFANSSDGVMPIAYASPVTVESKEN